LSIFLEVGTYLLLRKTASVIVSPNLVEEIWLNVGLVHIKETVNELNLSAEYLLTVDLYIVAECCMHFPGTEQYHCQGFG